MAPRRPRAAGRLARWPGNFGVVVAGALLARLVFPVTAVVWAGLVEARGAGIFNLAGLPAWLGLPSLAVAMLALEHTSHLVVRTSVTLAFVRSPLLLAYTAWDLSTLRTLARTALASPQVRRRDVDWAFGIAAKADAIAEGKDVEEFFHIGDDLQHRLSPLVLQEPALVQPLCVAVQDG